MERRTFFLASPGVLVVFDRAAAELADLAERFSRHSQLSARERRRLHRDARRLRSLLLGLGLWPGDPRGWN